jgi:DNA-directed RNA polymerase specialized sigma24 family protein
LDRQDRRTIQASIRKHADFVARSLRNLGVDDTHVDTAVQKVFLLALREETGLRAIADEASLFRAAARVAAQARRRWPRHASPSPTPRSRLDSALDSLPEDLREVFVLCEIEQRDASFAAATLGHHTSWARTRLRRAHRAYCAKFGVPAETKKSERLAETLAGDAALALEAGRSVNASPRARERSLHAVDAVTSTSVLGRLTLLLSRVSLAVFLALGLLLAGVVYLVLR